MGPQRNQREVEERLRAAVRHDRARIQIGKISRFGLLELSRQRLRPSLEEATQSVCPRCSGAGNIRSVESLALAILRLVGEEARKDRTAKVIAQLPMDVANYMLNEKRDWVQTLQEANGVQVVLLGNPDLETPNYVLRRVRDDEIGLPENAGTSYKLLDPKADISVAYEEIKKQPKTEEAAVSNVLPATPAPTPVAPPAEEAPKAAPVAVAVAVEQIGIFTRLWRFLFGTGSAPPVKTADVGEGDRPRLRRAATTAIASEIATIAAPAAASIAEIESATRLAAAATAIEAIEAASATEATATMSANEVNEATVNGVTANAATSATAIASNARPPMRTSRAREAATPTSNRVRHRRQGQGGQGGQGGGQPGQGQPGQGQGQGQGRGGRRSRSRRGPRQDHAQRQGQANGGQPQGQGDIPATFEQPSAPQSDGGFGHDAAQPSAPVEAPREPAPREPERDYGAPEPRSAPAELDFGREHSAPSEQWSPPPAEPSYRDEPREPSSSTPESPPPGTDERQTG